MIRQRADLSISAAMIRQKADLLISAAMIRQKADLLISAAMIRQKADMFRFLICLSHCISVIKFNNYVEGKIRL